MKLKLKLASLLLAADGYVAHVVPRRRCRRGRLGRVLVSVLVGRDRPSNTNVPIKTDMRKQLSSLGDIITWCNYSPQLGLERKPGSAAVLGE